MVMRKVIDDHLRVGNEVDSTHRVNALRTMLIGPLIPLNSIVQHHQVTNGAFVLLHPFYAPCLAFSAHIMAMILLSSALCAACSLMIFSSTPADFESSAVVMSMRFCSCSIFWSVLSRKGAEKDTCSDELLLLNRISSFRGRFFSSGSATRSCGFGLNVETVVSVAFLPFKAKTLKLTSPRT